MSRQGSPSTVAPLCCRWHPQTALGTGASHTTRLTRRKKHSAKAFVGPESQRPAREKHLLLRVTLSQRTFLSLSSGHSSNTHPLLSSLLLSFLNSSQCHFLLLFFSILQGAHEKPGEVPPVCTAVMWWGTLGMVRSGVQDGRKHCHCPQAVLPGPSWEDTNTA